MAVKRICFFAGHFDPARQAIMNYYEKIFPKEIEFFLVCAKDFDDKKYKLNRSKITALNVGNFSAIWKLRKFCKENKIDIVTNLTGDAEMFLALALATINTKTKNIYYFQGNPKFNLKASLYLLSQFFTYRIIACGRNVSDRFKKFLFISKNKIFYVPYPINIHKFRPKNKDKLRKKLGFKKDDKVIMYAGRIEPEQGSDYFLELIKNNPDKKFLLIGQINDENYKNHKFKNLTLIPFVPHTKMPDYYNMADLCIFLTKRNSYPYPHRESMACGVPVIVFDIDSFYVVTSPAIIKVPFDVKEIQEQIDRFFSLSKKERQELSKNGRNFVINDSSEEKIKGETLKYLSEV